MPFLRKRKIERSPQRNEWTESSESFAQHPTLDSLRLRSYGVTVSDQTVDEVIATIDRLESTQIVNKRRNAALPIV